MSTGPLQPIPDRTQHAVDRLVGTTVGGYEVRRRVSDGRYGTLYEGHQPASGAAVTLQVLRTELSGHDEEVRAVNALKCPGVAVVSAFGELPDGRRFRVLEPLEAESLERLLERQGAQAPLETVRVLIQVATVLEVTHAWAITHGCLGPSSVFPLGDAVKLIDFGLTKKAVPAQEDLQALGALGFTLLTGQPLVEGAPRPPGNGIPGPLAQVLEALQAQRLENATAARKALEALVPLLEAPPPPTPSKRGPWLALAAAGVAAAIGAGALWSTGWQREPPPAPPLAPSEPDEVEALDLEEPDEPALEPPAELETPAEATATQPTPRPTPTPRAVPSAGALAAEISRLETRLRRQTRPGDELDQALYMLNKQRLRLTGSPSAEDRRDVAQQLRGWKRSYLRP